MALAPGIRLGPYEIVSLLGAGGMGEVYRATDTDLKRQVAIKVLPASLAGDAERLARLRREAEVLAALNHPNIAHIYGLEKSDGTVALVMELVEGPTLADRIAEGSIPLAEALPIARQIAEALEAAHEQGVVHRDLKPANIKVRPDGMVKVLDFGLAKAMDPFGSSGTSNAVTNSPTITSPARTQAGIILGTPAYMSPEQAKGRAADKRGDVWAFGCVLYEMLTGARAFAGENVADTLAAVLRAEPNWERLPRDISPAIAIFLQRTVHKDARERVGDIHDVRLALEGVFDVNGTPLSVPTTGGLAWRGAFVAAIAVIVALVVPIVRHLREPTSTAPAAIRFQVSVLGNGTAEMFRVSPDGRSLVFIAPDGGVNRVWWRSFDSLDVRSLPGSDGAAYPFWSPDNEHVAFFAQGKLKKIAITGGPPQTLCDAAAGRGGTWNRAGQIVFSPGPVGGLYSVPSAGGVPTAATQVPVVRSTEGHRFPDFLPDGRHFLYVVESASREEAGIYIGSLDGSAKQRLLPDISNAVYASTSGREGDGLVLFRREDSLMAQPFDADQLHTTGDIFPVTGAVGATGNSGSGAFSVAAHTLVFRSGDAARRELVWVERTGKRLAAVTEPFRDQRITTGARVALSPDERHVLFATLEGEVEDLRLQNLTQGQTAPFTLGPGRHPIWSPDGNRIVFVSGDALHQMSASGGDEQVLLKPDQAPNVDPSDWSPDGNVIVYPALDQRSGNDLWLLPMSGAHEPVAYLQTPASETQARFSPNGKWIAYVSNESGRNQVYVQAIPATGGRSRISTGGGSSPKWRGDGKELFFVAPDQRLMAVPITGSGNAEGGTPQPLPVTVPVPSGSTLFSGYTPARDGQRFLINLPAGGEAASAPVTVLVNWEATLRRR